MDRVGISFVVGVVGGGGGFITLVALEWGHLFELWIELDMYMCECSAVCGDRQTSSSLWR